MGQLTDVTDVSSTGYYDTAQQQNGQLIIESSSSVCRFTITFHQEGIGKNILRKFH